MNFVKKALRAIGYYKESADYKYFDSLDQGQVFMYKGRKAVKATQDEYIWCGEDYYDFNLWKDFYDTDELLRVTEYED